jgi:hypothetical protein
MPLIAGRWYFFVSCRNDRCREAIVVDEAPEPLTAEELASDCDYVEAACRKCGTPGKWYMREWRRIQTKSADNANDN